jgi:hypothetical protein
MSQNFEINQLILCFLLWIRMSVVSMEINYDVSIQQGKFTVRSGTIQNLIYAMTLLDNPGQY